MNPDPALVTSRRTALKILGAGAAAAGLGLFPSHAAAAESSPAGGALALPPLGYAYDALEPHIDARTMQIHHSAHHAAYVNNANKALADLPALRARPAEEILRRLNEAPETVREALRNNVGGHANHTFFWQVLRPGGAKAPGGKLAAALASGFGSVDDFKNRFADTATKHFGSGWAWLVQKDGKLAITATANQDSPLSDGATPIVGVDVWEHAYYLKHQNRRADYLAAFWNVLNWDEAAKNFAAA